MTSMQKTDSMLVVDEPLIFEQDNPGAVGVDVPFQHNAQDVSFDHATGSHFATHSLRQNGLLREDPIGLPSLSESQIVRHYTRLSQKNYGIDTVFYPLGSCTMKHNPRLNEKMARLAGFANIHPLQPFSTVQGALQLIQQLSHWLLALTGMSAVALSPGAGAHGEFCGLAAIKTALKARGEKRTTVLVPASAHGTNPATAAALGFAVESIPANAKGRVDFAALRSKLSPDVAALMLTNPNTCGLFENEIIEIAKAVHEAGSYFYCDGANFNAIVGRVKPADLGIDAMHINLHKTFSTPHGGGGPGAGPVVFAPSLAAYVPVPYLGTGGEGQLKFVEHVKEGEPQHLGRLKGFHGQMGMFVRALSYILSHGADGLHQVSGDAVLNANYILSRLKGFYSAPFGDGPCMHEALFDDAFLKGTNVTTLDIAKRLLDLGFHPMTMYFPLVVHGAFLIEPTETESKATLDAFVAAMRQLATEAKSGEVSAFKAAPQKTPRMRLNETEAARTPILRWKKPA